MRIKHRLFLICELLILSLFLRTDLLISQNRLVTDSDNIPCPSKAYKKIIPLAPNLAEICIALGLEDRIIAVSRHSNYPEVKNKPKVGFWNINYEQLALLKPDLIITTYSGNPPQSSARLRELGHNVFSTRQQNIEEIIKTIKDIGSLTETGDRAESLIAGIRNFIASRKKSIGKEKTESPTVLFLIWHKPPIAPAGDTFISEIIALAGGRDIFSSEKGRLLKPSLERILRENPQVVFIPSGTNRNDFDSRWQAIEAFKKNRVYNINEDKVLRPGAKIIEAVREIEKKLHPPEQKNHDIQ